MVKTLASPRFRRPIHIIFNRSHPLLSSGTFISRSIVCFLLRLKRRSVKKVRTLHQPRYHKSAPTDFSVKFYLNCFQHKYLKIRTPHEAQYIFKMFCYEKRSFNRKEKVSSFILTAILVK